MKLEISHHSRTTETLMTRTQSVYDTSDISDFRALEKKLETYSKKHGLSFDSKQKDNHEVYMNSQSPFEPVHFEGGAEVWEAIRQVGVYVAEATIFLEFYQAILPVLRDYFKSKPRGKTIKVEVGKYKIKVKNTDDLKEALKIIKQVEKESKKKKK